MPFPEHRRADSCTKQLAGNIKYPLTHGDDYDEGGDDGAGNDDDDNAAVLPLSTFWAWSERGPHSTEPRRAQPLQT